MVLQDITVKEIPPRTIVYLQCSGPWQQLPKMLDRLNGHMSLIDLKAIGPASAIYYNTPNEVSTNDLKWEVFYPVLTNPLEPTNDNMTISLRKIPKTRIASIIHKGHYRKASSSYERLEEWIKWKGFKICGPSEEVYISIFDIPNENQLMEIRIPISST